jgi:hypothetical protein
MEIITELTHFLILHEMEVCLKCTQTNSIELSTTRGATSCAAAR